MIFLKQLFAIAFCLQTCFSQSLNCDNFDLRAVYVGSSEKIAENISFYQKNSINAVVIDVKNDVGEITCNLGNYKTNSSIKDIKSLLTELKKAGFYTIARVVVFQDREKVNEAPNLAIRNKDGSIYVDKEGKTWLNPYSKEVQNYIIDVAKLAAQAGFDEIQFDYIRFPPFKSLENTNIADDLKIKTKTQVINEFLQVAVSELHKLNVKLSVDVFGCIIWERNGNGTSGKLGQDYLSIAQIADYICPMIYPSHWQNFSFDVEYPDLHPDIVVEKSMELSKDVLLELHAAKVRPYLQAFTARWLKKGSWQFYKKAQIQSQITALNKTGIKQFCLWDPSGKYLALNM